MFRVLIIYLIAKIYKIIKVNYFTFDSFVFGFAENKINVITLTFF